MILYIQASMQQCIYINSDVFDSHLTCLEQKSMTAHEQNHKVTHLVR